jgi:hypothetical protein
MEEVLPLSAPLHPLPPKKMGGARPVKLGKPSQQHTDSTASLPLHFSIHARSSHAIIPSTTARNVVAMNRLWRAEGPQRLGRSAFLRAVQSVSEERSHSVEDARNGGADYWQDLVGPGNSRAGSRGTSAGYGK